MSKYDGWCIWNPCGVWLTTTFARTREESIELFNTHIDDNWRHYRRRGFACEQVAFVRRTDTARDRAQIEAAQEGSK